MKTRRGLFNLAMLAVMCSQLTACTSLVVKDITSASNHRVNTLVMHFTFENYARSMELLRDSGNVSSHYLVPALSDNTYDKWRVVITQLVEETDRAWHAGESYWQGRTHLNDTSIGIEIVNQPQCEVPALDETPPQGEYGPDRQCTFPAFEDAQINALITLSKAILARNPDITPTKVVGHSDIAPQRKSDPGPAFPWYVLYQNGIGAWYDEDTQSRYLSHLEKQWLPISLLQDALNAYGYESNASGELDQHTHNVIYAFQTHFLPERVTGAPDLTTFSVLFALLEKYQPQACEQLLEEYNLIDPIKD